MTVRTLAPDQVLTLEEHLQRAEQLDPDALDKLRVLAAQVDGLPVLPLLGAGASYECGVRLAAQISSDLYDDYKANTSYEHEEVSDPKSLGEVAQAIYNASDQVTAVKGIRLNEPVAWPTAGDISTHFCAYRVLARLVREGFIEKAVGFNYDCQSEAALDAEGFQRSAYTVAGAQWRDHADVITDQATHAALGPRGSYRLYKAHGCAARYRELAADNEEAAAETVILRKDQLYNWRSDLWIRDIFRALAREHVLLLIGLSGNDPVVAGQIQQTLRDVYQGTNSGGQARVIAMDYNPNTAALGSMIGYGLNREPPAAGVVTKISSAGATTTAAMLVLLTEWLALHLQPAFNHHGFTLPTAIGPRLAALTVSSPVMTRWSYMLHPGPGNHFMQHVNVHKAARHGYVPLRADPATTAHALRVRAQLRARLGATGEETPGEALADHGFLVSGGKAYLPVGLEHAELSAACRPGGVVDDARATLPHPHSLECILVSNSPSDSSGVNMHTGKTVSAP